MIYRILNQVSSDFFEYIAGATGLEIPIVKSEDYNQQQFTPMHDIVSVIDFAGVVTGFVAITLSQETLNSLVAPLFPDDSESEDKLKGEFLKEMTNGVTGTTVEILRENHPLVTGLKPKLMKGFLSFPKVPCFSKLIQTPYGDVCFSIAVDYMAMDINHFADRIKEVEKQLRESISQMEYRRDESEAHFRSKKQYLEAHSKEVNLPIDKLEGYSDMILDQRINEDHRDSLDVLKNVSEGLISLIYGTFEFKKERKTVQAIDELPFNLEHLIQEVVQGIQKKEIFAERSLKLDVMQTNYDVIGDPLKIGEVIQSLILNAIDLSKAADQIIVSMSEADDQGDYASIHFSVKVQPQSHPDKIDVIFDELCGEFLYSKANQESEMHSHLIHNSQTMVEAMGGKIGFVSNQTHGTSFSFNLTMKRDVVQELSEHSELAKKFVLMIEPDALQADLFRRLLHRLGMNVFIINDINNSFDALKEKVYDFVLFSDKLPSMEVLDLSRRIRAQLGLDAPCILTVFSEEFRHLNRDINTLPFSGILFKPLNYGSFKRVFQICMGVESPDNMDSLHNNRSELVVRSQLKIQYFGLPEIKKDSKVNSFKQLGLNAEFHANLSTFKDKVQSDDKLLILDLTVPHEYALFESSDLVSYLREIEFYGVIIGVVKDSAQAHSVEQSYSIFDDLIIGDLGKEQIHALLRRMGH